MCLGGRDNGLTIFEIPLYSANTILGTYYMRLIHNNNNQVGIYYEWVGQSGGTGATLNAELRTTFTPTDTGADIVRNSRGALQATANLPLNVSQGVAPTLTWTLASGSGLSINNNALDPPYLRVANNQIGWWFVYKQGGVDYSELMLPFAEQDTGRWELHFGGGRDNSIRLTIDNNGRFSWTAERTFNIPTNSTIAVYLAVI